MTEFFFFHLLIIFTPTHTPPRPIFRQYCLPIFSVRTCFLFVCEIFDRRLCTTHRQGIYVYCFSASCRSLGVLKFVFIFLFCLLIGSGKLLSILCSIFFLILLIYCIIAVTINCHATQLSNHFLSKSPSLSTQNLSTEKKLNRKK